MAKEMPRHIGIIMDGNRRWARRRGLPTLEGHRRGYDKLKEAGEWCLNRGVKVLTFFAFSVDNWNRSQEEVTYLMNLIHHALTKEADEFVRRNIQLRIIGRRAGLPDNVRVAADTIEERTKDGKRGLVQLAVNYSGHTEIIDAAQAISRAGIPADKITEELFAANLYAPDVPPVDLIIRTSGEQRLSGFLTWQSIYSELYFLEKYWPDFSEHDLNVALTWFSERGRRFGK